MTHLRKMMLEELERRNYAQTTINCYIQTIADFARYFRRPPDQLTAEHIREYQAYLFRERKLAASTVTQRLAALRFFYTQTIKKAWSVADTPYPKKTRHLPSILSPEEVKLPTSSTAHFPAKNSYIEVLRFVLVAYDEEVRGEEAFVRNRRVRQIHAVPPVVDK